MDVLDRMIAWEQDELYDEEVVELFSELVKSGMAWTLQGCYGRTARALIEAGILDNRGNILDWE